MAPFPSRSDAFFYVERPHLFLVILANLLMIGVPYLGGFRSSFLGKLSLLALCFLPSIFVTDIPSVVPTVCGFDCLGKRGFR